MLLPPSVQLMLIKKRLKPWPSDKNYLVSTAGEIWSIVSNRWLKPSTKESGHLRITWRKSNKSYPVHKMVLETFSGNCPDGYECCHIDGKPFHNHIYNLRWGTRSENIRDRIKHGEYKSPAVSGERHHRSLLTEEQVLKIRKQFKAGECYADLAQQYQVHSTTIGHIVNRYSWKHI